MVAQKSELLVCWCLCLDCFFSVVWFPRFFFLSLWFVRRFSLIGAGLLNTHLFNRPGSLLFQFLSPMRCRPTCFHRIYISERVYYSTGNIHVWTHGVKITTWKPSSNYVIKAFLVSFTILFWVRGVLRSDEVKVQK